MSVRSADVGPIGHRGVSLWGGGRRPHLDDGPRCARACSCRLFQCQVECQAGLCEVTRSVTGSGVVGST